MGDAIKYLYSQFILRDVLYSIAPGAVVVLMAFLTLVPEPTMGDRLARLFEYSRDMHWLLYVPLFGVFYVAGFAIDCLGRILGLVRIHPLDTANLRQRLGVFSPGWDRCHTTWKDWKAAQQAAAQVERAIKQEGGDWVQPTRERLIVLKQAGSNGFLAAVVAGVLLGVSRSPWQVASVLAVSLVAFLLVASLYWGYRWAKLALETVEDEVTSKTRDEVIPKT